MATGMLACRVSCVFWGDIVTDEFEVFSVPPNSYESEETMGTKEKFWYENTRFLFKVGRPGTGEDWAEKAASELIQLIGLPAARYDFANFDGTSGTRSHNILSENHYLIHGNELLAKIHPSYDKDKIYKQRQHTVRLVLKLLSLLELECIEGGGENTEMRKGSNCFVGYLLFDAWIGNTDRHHENWAIIGDVSGDEFRKYLAPSYDHASSLGCRLSVDKKQRKLTTKDQTGNVYAFAKRARSALTRATSDTKNMSTHEAFFEAARLEPGAAVYWANKMVEVSNHDVSLIFNKIPVGLIDDVDKRFAMAILEANKQIIKDGLNKLGLLQK